MSYIKGENRSQMTLFADCIEELVAQDNPARAIEAFVMALDVTEMGFTKAQPAGIGRYPYDPKDLLKLYIYGYLNGIRSSRKLEAEAGRNIELMWLLCKLKPDFKTIADFRRDNKDALVNVFRRFNAMCKDWGLYSETLIAIDGSKFRANNSKRNNFNPKKIKRHIEYLNQQIDDYMASLDQADETESALTVPNAEEIKRRIAEYKQRKQNYEIMLDKMQAEGIEEISATDTDARMMSANNNGLDVCYNVQTAVDSKHSLVVDCEVINNPTDHGQLNIMGKRARKVLGLKNRRLKVLADKGYHSTNDLIKCEKGKLTAYVAKQRHPSHQEAEFQLDNFEYDEIENVYHCPAGQTLYPSGKPRITNNVEYQGYKNNRACRTCEQKERCTKNNKGRTISRNCNQELLDKIERRTNNNKKLYQQRQMIVEHPFGTVKRQWGFYYFLTRGLRSVKTEASLMFLTYNIRRVMNILGIQGMKEKLSLV